MKKGEKTRAQLLAELKTLQGENAQLRQARPDLPSSVPRYGFEDPSLSPLILLEFDQADRVIRESGSALSFFGTSRIGKLLYQSWNPDPEWNHRLFVYLKQRGGPFCREQWQTTQNGRQRLLLWQLHLIETEHKPADRGLAVAFDITDHHFGKHRREVFLSSILENIIDGVVIIDDKGTIVSFNRFAEKLFGYQSAEVIGRNISMLMPSPFAEEHDNYLQEYLRSGKAKVIGRGREVTGLRKDGTSFPFFLSISPGVKVGDRLYFSGMIRDLSREKQVEAHLRQAQKMETIGTLAGGIAHDFNNILGGLTGYTELMLEDAPKDSDFHEDLLEMLKGCNRAKALIRQILTFSRQDKPQREPLHLPPLIKETLKLLRATLPSSIQFQEDIDPSCAAVSADATQMHQVMINLCTNAAHAMRDMGGILSVTLKTTRIDKVSFTHHLGPGTYVQLQVRDTGIGLDDAVKARIFDPFFTTKSVGEGTGMGLAVVHGIIQTHGGEIVVDSRLGQGATFTIWIPCLEDQAPFSKPRVETVPKGKERIMLVEDDPFLLKAQSRMLTKLGYEVISFSNGIDALKAFREQPRGFHLVITDQTMPKKTGVELGQALLKERPDLPIVLTSGFSDMLSPQKARSFGFRDFLLKPVTKQKMAATLHLLLKES